MQQEKIVPKQQRLKHSFFRDKLVKMLHFQATFNNTYVAIQQQGKNPQRYLVHVDKCNKELWRKQVPHEIGRFYTVVKSQVMLLNQSTNSIQIICLHTHEIKVLTLPQSAKEARRIQIFPFCKTRFICVIVNNKIDKQTVSHLYYYDYLKMISEQKPFEQCKVIDKHSKFQFFKLNEHSKVGWCKKVRQAQKKIVFSYYQIDNQDHSIKKVATTNNIVSIFGEKHKELTIKRMRQFKRDYYIIVADMHIIEGCPRNGFKVVPTHNGYAIQPVPMLMQPELSAKYQARNLCQAGDFTLIHSQGKMCNYYIDNEYEYIIATDVNENTHQKIHSSGWDSTTFMRVHHYHITQQESDQRQRKRRNRLREKEGQGQIIEWNTFYALKDIYMSFLLQINEDFDDDLLQDAIQMLTQ